MSRYERVESKEKQAPISHARDREVSLFIGYLGLVISGSYLMSLYLERGIIGLVLHFIKPSLIFYHSMILLVIPAFMLIGIFYRKQMELTHDLKKRTDALRDTNELLEKIFSTTHLCIAYMDIKFNFIRVNRAYARADEQQPEFFIGKNYFRLYPNKEIERIFRQVVEAGKPYSAFATPLFYVEHPERGVTYWFQCNQITLEPYFEFWDNPVTNRLVTIGYTIMAISFGLVILIFIIGTVREKLMKKEKEKE